MNEKDKFDQGLNRRSFLYNAWKITKGASTAAVLVGCRASETPPQVPVTAEPSAQYLDMFFIGPDVPTQIHREIIDGVRGTHQWFLSHNIPIPPGISVYAFNNSADTIDQYLQRAPIPPNERESVKQSLRQATAWAGFSKDIYIITNSPGWTYASPIIGGPIVEGRAHTIAHEVFHIAQRELGAYQNSPVAWMNEGSGHYIAVVMLKDRGIYDYAKIRNGHIKEASKVKEPLVQLESNQTFYMAGDKTTADEYSLAFLAVEFATLNLPNSGIDALVDYWRKIGQGTSHQQAFSQAFGKTIQDFYQEFEVYRQTGIFK